MSYLRQKSIEFSGNLVFTSQILMHSEASLQRLDKFDISYPITSTVPFGQGFKHPILKHGFLENTPIQEIVFVGEMTEEGGLVEFSDAISLLHNVLPFIKVTFFGPLSQINGVESVEYIRTRATNEWHKFTVSVHSSFLHAVPVLKYLTAPNTMRAAVITAHIPNLLLIQELVLSGTPLLMTESIDHVAMQNEDSASFFQLKNSNSIFEQLKKVTTVGARPPVANLRNIRSGFQSQLSLFENLSKSEAKCQTSTGLSHSDLRIEMTRNPLSLVLIHPADASLDMLKKSVASIESQAYPKLEVVVVATHDTKAEDEYINNLASRWWELRAWKVFQIVHESKNNLYNLGITQVNNDFVTIIRSGTVLKPNYMEIMMQAALRANADLVFAGIDDPVSNIRQLPLASRKVALTSGNHLHGVFICKNSLLKELGGFEGNLDALFMRASLLNKKIEAISESVAWSDPASDFGNTATVDLIDHVSSNINMLPITEHDLVQKLLKKRSSEVL
ncbi:hypothetical protein HMI54_007040, partial [Coelomomyces lativittatus]